MSVEVKESSRTKRKEWEQPRIPKFLKSFLKSERMLPKISAKLLVRVGDEVAQIDPTDDGESIEDCYREDRSCCLCCGRAWRRGLMAKLGPGRGIREYLPLSAAPRCTSWYGYNAGGIYFALPKNRWISDRVLERKIPVPVDIIQYRGYENSAARKLSSFQTQDETALLAVLNGQPINRIQEKLGDNPSLGGFPEQTFLRAPRDRELMLLRLILTFEHSCCRLLNASAFLQIAKMMKRDYCILIQYQRRKVISLGTVVSVRYHIGKGYSSQTGGSEFIRQGLVVAQTVSNKDAGPHPSTKDGQNGRPRMRADTLIMTTTRVCSEQDKE
ncbi:uncharacterized protein EV420DRAFT_1484575 [Desarmillaria tabescens]|uniref:Uncharacterized protein n=1 Tax=Armillaria tabescens TaxID=1929756 RepID=A0AA39JMV5_ARMTA|nr:uncharacterized protein EV420DRAFT_1484575 [Desarmillaria tabescens]KAK0444611.1 hypothetical protein EV420DRAFT_1484575 [Desarmillaria tabescens]